MKHIAIYTHGILCAILGVFLIGFGLTDNTFAFYHTLILLVINFAVVVLWHVCIGKDEDDL